MIDDSLKYATECAAHVEQVRYLLDAVAALHFAVHAPGVVVRLQRSVSLEQSTRPAATSQHCAHSILAGRCTLPGTGSQWESVKHDRDLQAKVLAVRLFVEANHARVVFVLYASV